MKLEHIAWRRLLEKTCPNFRLTLNYCGCAYCQTAKAKLYKVLSEKGYAFAIEDAGEAHKNA